MGKNHQFYIYMIYHHNNIRGRISLSYIRQKENEHIQKKLYFPQLMSYNFSFFNQSSNIETAYEIENIYNMHITYICIYVIWEYIYFPSCYLSVSRKNFNICISFEMKNMRIKKNKNIRISCIVQFSISFIYVYI